MKFKPLNVKRYLATAPLALALERSWECSILSQQTFTRPILDIGCGEGIFAYNLFDERIDVAIDPNARELERAHTYGMYHELIECYGNDIPRKDANFKTIFSNSVMEHIEEIEPVLTETHRLLDEGGTVYLTLPTDKFEEYTWISQLLRLVPGNTARRNYQAFFNRFWAHYHCYDRAGWQTLFERNGFKVIDTFEYGSRAQCLFNALASPFSVLPFVTKRITNRWFLSTIVRKLIGAPVLSAVFGSFGTLRKQKAGKGGLIFFALQKK